jgi:hypothetical protein
MNQAESFKYYLSREEFELLSQSEKIAYLDRAINAVRAMRDLARVTDPQTTATETEAD